MEQFLNIDPSSKRGRKPIEEKLKDEIEQLQFNNSRPAAKCLVTNPDDRSERRPWRRLLQPARHIIIASEIYKQERASYGTIQGYRLWWVLPPTTDDGLCHQCLTLRNHIAYIHKEICHTDPGTIEGKKQETREHNLVL